MVCDENCVIQPDFKGKGKAADDEDIVPDDEAEENEIRHEIDTMCKTLEWFKERGRVIREDATNLPSTFVNQITSANCEDLVREVEERRQRLPQQQPEESQGGGWENSANDNGNTWGNATNTSGANDNGTWGNAGQGSWGDSGQASLPSSTPQGPHDSIPPSDSTVWGNPTQGPSLSGSPKGWGHVSQDLGPIGKSDAWKGIKKSSPLLNKSGVSEGTAAPLPHNSSGAGNIAQGPPAHINLASFVQGPPGPNNPGGLGGAQSFPPNPYGPNPFFGYPPPNNFGGYGQAPVPPNLYGGPGAYPGYPPSSNFGGYYSYPNPYGPNPYFGYPPPNNFAGYGQAPVPPTPYGALGAYPGLPQNHPAEPTQSSSMSDTAPGPHESVNSVAETSLSPPKLKKRGFECPLDMPAELKTQNLEVICHPLMRKSEPARAYAAFYIKLKPVATALANYANGPEWVEFVDDIRLDREEMNLLERVTCYVREVVREKMKKDDEPKPSWQTSGESPLPAGRDSKLGSRW